MRWAKGFPGKNAFQRKILGLLEVERFKFSVADAVNLSIKSNKLEKKKNFSQVGGSNKLKI